jgi:hypothetical protein
MINLSEMKNLGVHAPEAMNACVAFGKAAFTEGAIPRKDKKRIEVAVTLTTQCPRLLRTPREQGTREGRVGPRDRRIHAGHCGIAHEWPIIHGMHAMKGV